MKMMDISHCELSLSNSVKFIAQPQFRRKSVHQVEISQNVHASEWLKRSSRRHDQLRNISFPKFSTESEIDYTFCLTITVNQIIWLCFVLKSIYLMPPQQPNHSEIDYINHRGVVGCGWLNLTHLQMITSSAI